MAQNALPNALRAGLYSTSNPGLRSIENAATGNFITLRMRSRKIIFGLGGLNGPPEPRVRSLSLDVSCIVIGGWNPRLFSPDGTLSTPLQHQLDAELVSFFFFFLMPMSCSFPCWMQPTLSSLAAK